MRRISVEERRARLGRRHRLAASARVDDDVAAISRSVVAFHASDPASVVLSAVARMAHPDPAAVERALYDDRRVLRMLGMRRTLFTVDADLAHVVHASSTVAVAANERRKLVKLIEDGGIARDGAAWLERVEQATLAAVDGAGGALATEATKLVPELAAQVTLSEGKAYAATVSMASKVLFQLAAEGHLVRGRPTGRWTSSQHRWSTTAQWLGGPLADVPVDEARIELTRRWLDRFGPGTVDDLKWWTGWTLGTTRAAVAGLATETVELADGSPGLVLADDVDPEPAVEPWVALLPSLDATPMGWRERSWYLGPHKERVFDRNGNVGPTIWVDGRIVGGWAQRRDNGEVVTRLLDDVGTEAASAIDAAASALQVLLGDLRVTPRFPTPIDRELSA